MEGFLKIAASVIVSLVLYLTIAKQSKDIATLVSIGACVVIAMSAMHYLQPTISFFSQLQSIGHFDAEYIAILIRCVGIGIFTEICSLLCIDAGNAALGKTFQFAAGTIVLWQSLPLFTTLIGIIEDILLLI